MMLKKIGIFFILFHKIFMERRSFMHDSGIVRRIDDLGFKGIPKESGKV